LISFLNYSDKYYLVIAASQIFARDNGDSAIFTGLFADATTNAFSIVHNPGFAVDHLKKGIRTIQDTLETTGTFLQIDFYSHFHQILNHVFQITNTKNQASITGDYPLNQMIFL